MIQHWSYRVWTDESARLFTWCNAQFMSPSEVSHKLTQLIACDNILPVLTIDHWMPIYTSWSRSLLKLATLHFFHAYSQTPLEISPLDKIGNCSPNNTLLENLFPAYQPWVIDYIAFCLVAHHYHVCGVTSNGFWLWGTSKILYLACLARRILPPSTITHTPSLWTATRRSSH